MKLSSEWKEIVKKAWSFRLMALTALLEVCSIIFSFVYIGQMSHVWFGFSAFSLTLASMVARVISQRNLQCVNNAED